jgi:hypothetical protein
MASSVPMRNHYTKKHIIFIPNEVNSKIYISLTEPHQAKAEGPSGGRHAPLGRSLLRLLSLALLSGHG